MKVGLDEFTKASWSRDRYVRFPVNQITKLLRLCLSRICEWFKTRSIDCFFFLSRWLQLNNSTETVFKGIGNF